MAGLFGFLDFTRNGPGVEKNAPQKRSVVVFFEIFGRKFWHLICAGILYWLVNIPVITGGWAQVGLTYITRSFAREKHAFVREDFFETVRKNRKQALLCGLINLAVTGILLYNLYTLALYPMVFALFGIKVEPVQLDTMGLIVLFTTIILYTLFTVMKYYIPFMIITFSLPTGRIYRNAFIFAGAGFWRNLLISVVLLGIYGLLGGLMLLLPYAITYWLVLLMVLLILPGFRSLLIQYTLFPVFKKWMIDPYYEKNPDADKQLRRNLNLDVQDDPQETVFTDEATAEQPDNLFPRQYSAEEMHEHRMQTSREDDDDNTI